MLALQQKTVDGYPDFSKQAFFSQLSSNWLPVVDRKLEHYVGGTHSCVAEMTILGISVLIDIIQSPKIKKPCETED